jgi:hypothetical protein
MVTRASWAPSTAAVSPTSSSTSTVSSIQKEHVIETAAGPPDQQPERLSPKLENVILNSPRETPKRSKLPPKVIESNGPGGNREEGNIARALDAAAQGRAAF